VFRTAQQSGPFGPGFGCVQPKQRVLMEFRLSALCSLPNAVSEEYQYARLRPWRICRRPMPLFDFSYMPSPLDGYRQKITPPVRRSAERTCPCGSGKKFNSAASHRPAAVRIGTVYWILQGGSIKPPASDLLPPEALPLACTHVARVARLKAILGQGPRELFRRRFRVPRR